MGTMGRCRWKCHNISSLRCILQRQFFYSTSIKTTMEEPISAAPDSLPSMANFLVGFLGFSEQQALSTSSKLSKFRQSRGATEVRGFNLRNADLVIRFLQEKGLKKPQIRNIVYSTPQILSTKIEQTLVPKLKAFQDLGLSVSDFAYLISTYPAILHYSLHSTIHPALEALREIMGSDENVVRAIKGFRLDFWARVTKHLVCNVSLLRAQGIPIESIQKRLLQQSSPFMLRPETFKGIMAQVEEKWGVSPCSSMFLHAVQVLGCYNEKTITSKCRVFESFGWDRSQVVDLFRRNPYCLGASEAMIKTKLSFFMNELGYDPGYIAARADAMLYSLEKRILPRHHVLQLLTAKGLIKAHSSVYTAIRMTESQFLKRFIRPFEDDLPNLYNVYINNIGSCARQKKKGGRQNTYSSRIKLKPDSAGK